MARVLTGVDCCPHCPHCPHCAHSCRYVHHMYVVPQSWIEHANCAGALGEGVQSCTTTRVSCDGWLLAPSNTPNLPKIIAHEVRGNPRL